MTEFDDVDVTDKRATLEVAAPPVVLNNPILPRPQPHLMRQRKGAPQSINGEGQQ
ncbi:hypothetical protein [Burkholderia gladioli]|uniref:hypothetical protein n=1 Tax=Burkholderia gladioli TaxID=28095 RepID=UPI0022DA9BFF|nr:hypothetical protein [Burkholderia gladioli]MDA0574154.1 hypothetical protein [Burkholderia gladioli]MDA0602277.1 hypothetical protein [Burkholderia gladioli]